MPGMLTNPFTLLSKPVSPIIVNYIITKNINLFSIAMCPIKNYAKIIKNDE